MQNIYKWGLKRQEEIEILNLNFHHKVNIKTQTPKKCWKKITVEKGERFWLKWENLNRTDMNGV